MLEAMEQAGAQHVLVDTMNLYPKVRSSVRSLIAHEFPERLPAFEAVVSDPGAYAAQLAEAVESAAEAVGIEVDICF
jgi:hypothetical protein